MILGNSLGFSQECDMASKPDDDSFGHVRGSAE